MPTKTGSDVASCWTSRWMKIVNNHNPSCWQGSHSTSDVSSTNRLFPQARMLVSSGVGPSFVQNAERKTNLFFFFLASSQPCLLYSSQEKENICLQGKPRSITYPQHAPIRLILARVAPNLAAWEQWVECFESYQSKASSAFGRQKGSTTSVCRPGWLISSSEVAVLTDRPAWKRPGL